VDNPPKKLLDQVREAIRIKHYSFRTEQTYVEWIKRFILFHHKRHPAEMGAPEVQAFISFLAVERHVAASTQKQALGAVLFLYRHVLNQPVEVPDILRPETVGHLPTVLTHPEAMLVIDKMSGTSRLMAKLLYGSGLGLMECLRLRVKDVDFGNHQIIVRDGKGEKDRVTVLPDSLISALQVHLSDVNALHQKDLKDGYGFRMHWIGNTRMPPGNGPGSIFFQPLSVPGIRSRARSSAIIWMKVFCKKPSVRRRSSPG
jgi:integrase